MNVKEKYSSDAQFNEYPDDLSVNGLTRDELAFLAGTTAEIIAQLADLDLIAPCPLRRSASGETSSGLRLRDEQGELSEAQPSARLRQRRASARSETLLFQTEAVQQVRKILRMRRHLQISFDSMALIFDLLDRIDALEKKCRMKNEETKSFRHRRMRAI